MKKSRNRYIHERLHREYQLYNIINNNKLRYDTRTHDIGCQLDSKCGDMMICTCRKNSSKRHNYVNFSGFPKQVYAYHKTNFADIGTSSIKTIQKRRVKRIYLPETDDRGVGSSDLSSYIVSRKPRYAGISYYDHKRTSSKCVGGIRQSIIECVVSAKLSPLVRPNSVSTGPKLKDEERTKKNILINSSFLKRNVVTNTTQVESEQIKMESIAATETNKPPESSKQITKKISKSKLIEKKSKETVITPTLEKRRTPINKTVTDAAEKVFSSDSLVQHIHNLENPCQDKHSRTSLDPMENKLEREYRRMFCTKSINSKLISDQDTPDLNSTSLLRRRFEALRRGLAQKEDLKKNAVIINKELSTTTTPSKRDVSIASDPPSLEARSYSYTKINSPYESHYDQGTTRNAKSVVNKKERGNVPWSQASEEADEEGVRGMFKLWGKKFDFEEGNSKHICPSFSNTKVSTKKVQKEPETYVVPKTDTNSKKEKKFFFFRKKSKDKTKPYKSKKGVTAGRCEVKDGLLIKIGKADGYSVHAAITEKEPDKPNCGNISDEYESILKKAWLKKFLEQTVESKNSVQIRWNNKTYATSSSTIFEIMDDVYRQTKIALQSKSDMSTGDSSLCQTFKKQHVNFVQDIEAWMIPKLILEIPGQLPINVFNNDLNQTNDIINNIDQKYFVDKSKDIAHKIEVVLHSINVMNHKKDPSIEYLTINIPKGFFSDSLHVNDECAETSNSEEVYKIVEYETPDSNTRFRINKAVHTENCSKSNISVTISVKDNKLESKILETDVKNRTSHRDVVIQESIACDPKLRDVIGVGIITHRDIRDIRKPILKIRYDYSDEGSDYERTLRNNQKTCEFAESYLQDVYRHWAPLGMEIYSGCVSDSHLQGYSDTSQAFVNNQGDCTKSCPNICDDYEGSAIVLSCDTSSCSNCAAVDNCNQQSLKFFDRFKRKSKSEPDGSAIRVLPKDSLEVLKKRQLYSCSNKSKWFYDGNKPHSIPSTEDKSEEMISKSKTVLKDSKNKLYKKHVSLPGCDVINSLLAKQLSGKVSGLLKGVDVCEKCKNKEFCAKHMKLTNPPHEIPQSPSKQSCEKKQQPECSTLNQPPCNIAKLSHNVPCTPPGDSPPCQINTCPPTLTCNDPVRDSPTHTLRPRPSGCPETLMPPPVITSPKLLTPPPCPRSPPCLQLPCPHASPSQRLLASSLSQPLCTASPPCGSPRKGSLESLKNLFKKKFLSGHLPSSDCPQTASTLPAKDPKNEKKPETSPTRSSKSSLQVMEKSSCDCIKEQFTWPMKTQVSKQLLCESCDKNPQEKSLQGTPRHSQVDCRTQKTPICAKPKPKHERLLKEVPPCPDPKKMASFPPSQRSDENIRIRIKKTTPSTEEIREGLNIKVQDADGQTLYERRDYTIQSSSKLEETYNIHRLSTQRIVSSALSNVHLDETNTVDQLTTKSEINIANQIEIHVKLNLTPRIETTEVNIDNGGLIKSGKTEISNDMRQTSQDVFLVKGAGKTMLENYEDNNDVNIKIVIKSFMPKSKKEHVSKDYSKKISDKFHSVSTGYSVVDDHIYSLDENKIEVKPSEEIITQEFTERRTISMETMHNIEKPATENATVVQNVKSIGKGSQILNAGDTTKSQNETKTKNIQEEKSEVHMSAKNEDEQENIQNETKPTLIPKDESKILLYATDEHKREYTETKIEEMQEQKSEVLLCPTDEHEWKNTPNETDIKETKEQKSEVPVYATYENDRKNTQNETETKMIREQKSEAPVCTTNEDERKTTPNETGIKEIQEQNATVPACTADQEERENIHEIKSQGIQEQKSRIPICTTDEEPEFTSGDPNDYNSTDSIQKPRTKQEKKEMLQKVFEKAADVKKNKGHSRMPILKKMLKIIFTSDSSDRGKTTATSNDLANDITYASLKPNYFKDTDSMNNYYNNDSMANSEDEWKAKPTYPTEEHSADSKESDSSECCEPQKNCVCSTLAERLKIDNIMGGGCCCRRVLPTNVDRETCCDLSEIDLFLLNYKTVQKCDVQIQSSVKSINEVNKVPTAKVKSKSSEMSKIMDDMSKKCHRVDNDDKNGVKKILRHTFLPTVRHAKEYATRRLIKNTMLGISDEGRIYVVNNSSTKNEDKKTHRKETVYYTKTADILQSYETKKAVLEIYAEKILSHDGEHFIAKLPKFVCNKEKDIEKSYREVVAKYDIVSDKDIVL